MNTLKAKLRQPHTQFVMSMGALCGFGGALNMGLTGLLIGSAVGVIATVGLGPSRGLKAN